MTCNGDITVYHYNEETETYKKSYFPRVFKGHTEKLISEKGGVSSSDIARVRIPTKLDIGIEKNDYVYFGSSDAQTPDKEKCLKVMAIRDNRFGANPHWRIDLE